MISFACALTPTVLPIDSASSANLIMLTSDEYANYASRTFAIDCPRMILRQNISEKPVTYEGPGSIYQAPDGMLKFKLYSAGVCNGSPFEELRRLLNAKEGEIIPHSEYFSLNATSIDGRAWHSEFILPKANYGRGGYGPVVTGNLSGLVNETSVPNCPDQSSSLTLWFAENFDFPGNIATTRKTYLGDEEFAISGDWDAAKFNARELDFTIGKEESWIILSARSGKNNLPPALSTRICEALAFTLFRSVSWTISSKVENGVIATTLRPNSHERKRGASDPPVAFIGSIGGEYVWTLFGCYLTYVSAHSEPNWHPLSTAVSSVISGSKGDLDLALLTVAVAVESVLKIGFSEVARPDKAFLAQIQNASELIGKSDLSSPIKLRLSGAVNAMKWPRVKDKLRVLVENGVFRKELVAAWESARNRSVHADALDPMEIAKVFAQYQAVRTLFNEIVFLLIGYMGKYKDYSAIGCPEAIFPHKLQ